MSYEFIHVFFPSSAYLLRRYAPSKFARMFPADVQQRCAAQTQTLALGGRIALDIRWPWLAPLTLVGIALGVYGYLQLRRPALRGRQRPQTPSWSLAMAFYALMNLAALGCHCLVPRSSPWQLPLVSLDIAATACSAFCAAYACVTNELGDAGQRRDGGTDVQAKAKTGAVGVATGPLVDVAVSARSSSSSSRGSRKRHMLNLLTWCGLFNTSAFFGLDIPFMPELLYLGTSLVSAVIVGRHLRRRGPRVGRQTAWLALLFLGGAVALSGTELDPHLCRAGLGAALNTATLVFGGCHVIMAALLLYVREDLRCRHGGEEDGAGRSKAHAE